MRCNHKNNNMGDFQKNSISLLACYLITVLLCFGGRAYGENGTAPHKDAYVSIIAVGPKPLNRFKRSGSRGDPDRMPIPLPPLEGAVPPSLLYFKTQEGRAKNPSWMRLHVGFNRSAQISKVPSGKVLQLFKMDTHHGKSYTNYVKLPEMNPGSQVLALIHPRKSGNKPWLKEPSISVLNLHSKALADKNVLVRNFSNKPLGFVIGSEKSLILASGQRRSFQICPNEKGQRIVAYTRGVKRVPILKTSIRLSQQMLTVIAFYDANPQANAGKPVGVFRATVNKRIPRS